MPLIFARTRLLTATVGAALALSACTVHKTEVPALTGPSGLGSNISIAVSPDVLTQDGASQSLVTITAFDSTGQPARNVQLRADIAVGGVVTDYGRLSAKSLVTDSSGRATAIYTAPPPPAVIVGNGTKVDIQVTPIDGNFDNSNPRVASIMLVPPGIIVGPASSFVPSFVVPSLNVGDQGLFSAKVIDANGADVTSQVASFQWNFGDGATASGQNVTHTFNRIGTFPVTLTITDAVGRTNFVTQSINVGQGQLPNALFTVSPAPPAVIGQTLNFNGSGSTAAPGHFLTDFTWDFGDGTTASGVAVTHAYTQTGTYVASLMVTDDAGRKSSLSQQQITVGNGNPTPDFTFNPSAPRAGQQVTFDASGSQPAPGRTIVSYSWSFGDGGSGSGQTTVHTFAVVGAAPTTYNVLLTVTDNQGKSSSITKAITVNP